MRQPLLDCSWLGMVAWVVCVSTALGQPSAVLYDGALGAVIGGYRAGKWLEGEKAAKGLKGGEEWTIYTADQTTESAGSAPKQMDEPFEHAFEISFENSPKSEDFLATTGLKRARLNPPRSGSTTIPAYIDATGEFLRNMGIAKPNIKLTQLIKVDLDADGEDEAILIATYYRAATEHGPSPNAAAGDYSVAFVRKLINGQVKTIPLVSEVYPRKKDFCAPNEYKFADALDLNGDGVMEVILRSNYYEGSGTAVFDVSSGESKEVMSNSLGV